MAESLESQRRRAEKDKETWRELQATDAWYVTLAELLLGGGELTQYLRERARKRNERRAASLS